MFVEHNGSWNFKGAAGAMRSTPTHTSSYTLLMGPYSMYSGIMYNIMFLYIRSDKMHHLKSLPEKAVVVYSFEHICSADSTWLQIYIHYDQLKDIE